MSRTVYYTTIGNEIYDETPSYAQEQLEKIEKREAAEADHPDYYKTGGEIEAIDVIEAWNLDFCLGNTVKHISSASRAGRKSDKAIEDLEAAAWYLNREIKRRKRSV